MSTIRKILDLSTIHLPPRYFAPESTPNVTGWHPTAWGVFLWVPDDPDDDANVSGQAGDAAPEIVELRRIARALGCDYILLDQDAEEDPDVPSFAAEWAVAQ